MKSQPDQGKSFIFETHGIDELPEDENIDSGEQNMDDEAEMMLRSWNRDNLLSEVEKDKDIYKRDVVTNNKYYDGYKSFDEIRRDMTPLERNYVHVKVTKSNPEGKEIHISSTILFDRIGFFEHNPLPWESSMHDGKPTLLNLTKDNLIAGLVQALITLRQGEAADILIHPHMAYGEIGVLPVIPPSAHIFYHVKIHKVWDESNFDSVLQSERELEMIVPLDTMIELAREHKESANRYLADNDCRAALVRYKAAINWLSQAREDEIQGSRDYSSLMSVLWQNSAIALNRLEMYKSASKAARSSLLIDPTNVKAYYQLAKARISLGDHEKAVHVLKRALRISPDSISLKQLSATLDTKLRDEKAKRDEIMTKMSKGMFV